ncbi:hypothetical protein ACP4OV_029502 [Aristida adscensionis]
MEILHSHSFMNSVSLEAVQLLVNTEAGGTEEEPEGDKSLLAPTNHSTSSLPPTKMEPKTKQIKLMTYNVWSREDIVVYKRMQAIGGLVEKHNPDVIFFQEITPYIRSIFDDLAWWKNYHCSAWPLKNRQPGKISAYWCLSKLPLENIGHWKFPNSPTGRGYLEADINPDPATMAHIRIATTQLERPNPPAPMHCMERYAQAKHAVTALRSAENVVFGGDMCWSDGTDRPFPLPAGWFDAWTAWTNRKCYSSSCSGRTYSGIWEEEVAAFNGYAAPFESLMRRSDRSMCKLKDYSLNGMELIGDGDIVLKYTKRKMFDPILLRPSCHRGLILTIVPNEPPAPPEVPPAPAPPHGVGAQAAGQPCTDYWEDSD